MKKYTQNILKYCVKNPFWSDFLISNQFSNLIFYMQKGIVLHFLKETRHLIQFLYACKIASTTDKRNTNESKKDLFKQDFLIFCVYFFSYFHYH